MEKPPDSSDQFASAWYRESEGEVKDKNAISTSEWNSGAKSPSQCVGHEKMVQFRRRPGRFVASHQGDDMTANRLRQRLWSIWFVLASPIFACAVFGQGTPLKIGPLLVIVPPGWTTQTDAVPVRIFSPDSTPQKYCSVEFFPTDQTTQDVREHHSMIWGKMAALVQPTVQPQSGVLGQFIWTRVEGQRAPGQRETVILYSAKTGPFYVAIAVEVTHPDLLARNLPVIEAMVRGALLDAPASSAPAVNGGNSASPQMNAGDAATLGDYVYTAPPGWTSNQYPDGVVLMSPVYVTNERCVFTFWPMRPAGANLLGDANNIFQDVYKTYEPSNQTARGSPMPPLLVHGVSGQGWEYAIVKRGIAPRGSRESRLGFVFVAKLNNRLAVISGVSKDPLVSSCLGEALPSVWPRFFYSLSFKGWTPTDQSAAMRKKMAGAWMIATVSAADQITFAGNGRFANAAASQQYSRISNSEALATTQAFFGNGAYTLRGNAITLTQDNQKNHPEPGFVRVEEESKDEGRTWAPILYLLKVSTINGEDYEVRYQRK